MIKTILVLFVWLAVASCSIDVDTFSETADEFVLRINGELDELAREVQAATWVRNTYITTDTALLNSLATQRYAEWQSRTVAESLKYEGRDLSPETARALQLLKLGTEAPAPGDEVKRRQLADASVPSFRSCSALAVSGERSRPSYLSDSATVRLCHSA